MSTRINDETLLLSKYLSNSSSNKAAEVEKATNSSTTTGKASGTTNSTKYDSLELSNTQESLVYNNYNSMGQYESMPSLVDYLGNDSSGSSSSSLVDFLGGGSEDTNDLSQYFNSLAEANEARVNKLIKEAQEKLKEKENQQTEATTEA